MTKCRPATMLLVLCLGSLSVAPAQGQKSKEIGDYTVHYIAVNSTFLQPGVAEQYGITRGDRRAFLNITVMKDNPDGQARAVTADVSGVKTNLLEQSETLEFIEVREGEAVYYLGEFEFTNTEELRFELEIQPENRGPVYPLEWTSRMYTNQ